MNNISKAICEIYSTGDMRTLVQLRDEEEKDAELLIVRLEKTMLDLLSTIEDEVLDFRKDRWMPHVEGQRVFYTFTGSSGKGMGITNTMEHAQVMLSEDGVDIRFMDGQALIENFGLRTNLYAWAKSENLAIAIAAKFNEFKKDGIKSVELQMNGFTYRNEK